MAIRQTLQFLFSTAVMCGLAACSAPMMVDAGMDVPVETVEQACTTLARSVCTRIGTCSDFATRLVYGDVATCEMRVRSSCVTSANAPGSNTGVAPINACASTLASASCASLFSRGTDALCTVTPGAGADGTACGFGTQCVTGFCSYMGAATCGTCAPVPVAAAACNSDADCGPTNLVCAMNRCVVPGAASAACDAARPCQATLACVAGSCTTPGAAGATCDATHPCDIFGAGVFCNMSTNTCATVMLNPAGGACGFASNVLTLCSTSGQCNVAAGMTTGTCASAAADGTACDTADGPGCLPPAYCAPTGSGTAGVCRVASGTCR